MVTENMVVLPETFNWLTTVETKGLNRSKTGYVLNFSTRLPQSRYPTTVYISPDQLVYPQEDGQDAVVRHAQVVPDKDNPGKTLIEESYSNIVEEGDTVYVQIHRGNLKKNEDDTYKNPDFCSSYFWDLESISPGEGTPLVQATLNTPRQQVNSPGSANGTGSSVDVGQNPTFEVRGDIKGHCEKIIAQLAVAKLLPGLEAEDGGIDWGLFRQYRDEYFHNVSNVPVEPLPSEEAEEVVEED